MSLGNGTADDRADREREDVEQGVSFGAFDPRIREMGKVLRELGDRIGRHGLALLVRKRMTIILLPI